MNKSPNFIIKVKNDKKGKKLIQEIREHYKKRDGIVKLRGRHSDRKTLYRRLGLRYSRLGQNEVPIEHAEEIGVYVYHKYDKNYIPHYELKITNWQNELG